MASQFAGTVEYADSICTDGEDSSYEWFLFDTKSFDCKAAFLEFGGMGITSALSLSQVYYKPECY